MKKVIITCLFVLAGSLCFAASDELEMYAYLYDGAPTHEGQLALLQTMAESKITGAGEFYAKAFGALVKDYQNIKGANEKLYAENQAILLASLLGQEKYAAAADDLWRAYITFSDTLVKAETLMSLGKIRASQFLPQVIKVLNDLNEAPVKDRLSGERVAFGAIISLEKYGDISGYLPVYFASKSWYNDRVKNQALRSLQIISADPTDYLISVIKSAGYKYDQKLAALQAVDASNVSGDSKSKTAVAAFTVGWEASTTNISERSQLRNIRMLSMDMIRANGCSDNSVYPLLAKSYTQYSDRTDGEEQECYSAINTLSTLATEEAAQRLSGFLMNLNDKQKSGNVRQKEEQLVRKVIPAIGAAKQAVARPVLNAVVALGWIETVKNLARQALQQIP